MNIVLVYIFVILAICIIFLLAPNSCPTLFGNNKIIEGFHFWNRRHKPIYPIRRYCTSCGYNSRQSCSSCINCGFCINSDGKGECISGDSDGPTFREDCLFWEYNVRQYPKYGFYPYNRKWINYKYRGYDPYWYSNSLYQ